MTVQDIILIADSMKPNKINEEVKLHWLDDVEGRIHCEILKASPDDYIRITTLRRQLSIPTPYAGIYISYILAMIAFAEKEYDLYTDISMRYEKEFSEYAKFCIRTR